VGVAGRISCYLRREDKIYLTYWTTGRGDEVMSPLFGLLDMTAYGRREEWEDSPEGWPQFPTHSFLRTDEHGAASSPRKSAELANASARSFPLLPTVAFWRKGDTPASDRWPRLSQLSRKATRRYLFAFFVRETDRCHTSR
jgi:hypothetical protein